MWKKKLICDWWVLKIKVFFVALSIGSKLLYCIHYTLITYTHQYALYIDIFDIFHFI